MARRRCLWRLGPSLALAALLQGCLSSRPTLHLVIVPTGRLEWLQQDERDRINWSPLLREFQRLHPGAKLQISVVQDDQLEQTLRRDRSRGLGPDLLLMRAPQANGLLLHGLVKPFNDLPTWRRSLDLLEPGMVARVNTKAGVSGLPVFNEVTLACYDRRSVSRPPSNLDELLALAASGRPIGVAVDPIGIWWSAGALGAQDAMVPILTGTTAESAPSTPAQRAALLAWLTWLRQLSLQSHVDIASGPRDLVEGLESGRLSWIPCFSTSLGRLGRTMGQRLGVAPLPSGPAGPPTPFYSLMVFSLGSDSSPPQRQLALDLAELSLDPRLQRAFTLQSRMVLPVNRFVPVPLASSGQLVALQQAQSQFNQSSRLLITPYPADHLRLMQPKVEGVLWKVMLGALTPQQGVTAMMQLPPPS